VRDSDPISCIFDWGPSGEWKRLKTTLVLPASAGSRRDERDRALDCLHSMAGRGQNHAGIHPWSGISETQSSQPQTWNCFRISNLKTSQSFRVLVENGTVFFQILHARFAATFFAQTQSRQRRTLFRRQRLSRRRLLILHILGQAPYGGWLRGYRYG
jgi:hypothetical protein